MDIQILVATHKKYWMPNDSIYLPIQVGAATCNDDFGYIRDDLGENISLKNANFCELTAIYWAWKNLKADYIGLCHYRRYFSKSSLFIDVKNNRENLIMTRNDYEEILEKNDIILPKKRNYYIETVESQYGHAHNSNDLRVVGKVIQDLCPEYYESYIHHLKKHKTHILNMFVMKNIYFQQYCKWLFAILFEVEKNVDISDRDVYQQRIFGFLSERLLDVWIEKNELHYSEVDIIELEPVNWIRKISSFIGRKIKG